MTTATITETSARTMYSREPIPAHLGEDFLRLPQLDRDWVWLVEHDGEAVGCAIASPCHGVAILLRVKVIEGAPSHALLVLLRRMFHDLRERKITGYMTWMGTHSDAERRLRHMTEQLGGLVIEQVAVAMASPLPPEER